MPHSWSLIATGAAALALLATAASRLRGRFAARTESELSALVAGAAASRRVVAERDLETLPEPVRRWLRWASVVGKPRPAVVRLTQTGRFRINDRAPWRPFTAEEFISTDPPAFLWRAKIDGLPFLAIEGRDRFADGKGSIDMRAAGILPVARASAVEVDRGALLRYLNEIIWAPAAALDPRIRWEAIDPTSARATISYGGMKASAIFAFDGEGRPITMTARRYELARKREETWSTPLGAARDFGGVRVPAAGTGVWQRASGDFAYIEVSVTSLESWPR